jgi:ABC-type branched-subunit amino acid transport system permease subunit
VVLLMVTGVKAGLLDSIAGWLVVWVYGFWPPPPAGVSCMLVVTISVLCIAIMGGVGADFSGVKVCGDGFGGV